MSLNTKAKKPTFAYLPAIYLRKSINTVFPVELGRQAVWF